VVTSVAYEEGKEVLSKAALLAFPRPKAEICIATDASEVAVGTVLQQRIAESWQPLLFFCVLCHLQRRGIQLSTTNCSRSTSQSDTIDTSFKDENFQFLQTINLYSMQ